VDPRDRQRDDLQHRRDPATTPRTDAAPAHTALHPKTSSATRWPTTCAVSSNGIDRPVTSCTPSITRQRKWRRS
jgi:hypothetical protein